MNLNDVMQGQQGQMDQRAMPQQQPAPPDQTQEQPNQQEQPDAQQGQVSPEAQQEFDIFVANGMSVIHSKKVTESILNSVAQNKNRLEAFAVVLVNVVSKLFDSAKSNNVKLTNDTLLHGSNVLLQEILGVAQTAGMGELSEEQKTEILQRGISMYLDQAVKTGRMTKDELIALGEQSKQTPEGQKVMQTVQKSGGF